MTDHSDATRSHSTPSAPPRCALRRSRSRRRWCARRFPACPATARAGRSGSRPRACSRSAHSRFAARQTRFSSSRPSEIARGVITYSSGNHAQGVAYAAREVGAKAVIVMPSNAPAIKRAATLALGAEVVDVGLASSERLAVAEELVREHGYVVIPPYDDEQIIAGQGTCGLEIVRRAAGRRPGSLASLGRRPAQRSCRSREATQPQNQSLRHRTGAGRRHRGEFSRRQNRHLAGGAHQPHHCRRPAHAERRRAQLRPHPGFCRRHHHRNRGRDSRRHARHRCRSRAWFPSPAAPSPPPRCSFMRTNCRAIGRPWPSSAAATSIPRCWPRCSPKLSHSVVQL